MLTDKDLAMYKALQPFFPEDWKIGDRIYYDNFPAVIVQIKTEEDLIYARFEDSRNFLSADRISFADENFMRLPLPIDPINPERGLWGMVEGLVGLYKRVDKWEARVKENELGYWYPYTADNPTTALLIALCGQWEAKV